MIRKSIISLAVLSAFSATVANANVSSDAYNTIHTYATMVGNMPSLMGEINDAYTRLNDVDRPVAVAYMKKYNPTWKTPEEMIPGANPSAVAAAAEANTAVEVRSVPASVVSPASNTPQYTPQTFAPSVVYVDQKPTAPAYIAPVVPQTPAAPVIVAPKAPDYAAIATNAKDHTMAALNRLGGIATAKGSIQQEALAQNSHAVNPNAVAQYTPAIQSMDHESRPNTGAAIPATVYNSQSQKANDHSQAIANIQGGKATAAGYITPPAYKEPTPQPLPAAAPVAPSVNVPAAPVVSTVVDSITPNAPVINAPQKQTQGGGVWEMAPDVKGIDQGQIVHIEKIQNVVAAPRPSTPLIVNPDVIGQPISTNTVAKTIALNPGQAPGGVAPVVDDSMPNFNTMDQGHNNPEGNPSTVVNKPDLSNKTPAAVDGPTSTPANSGLTIVNDIQPAKTVDKWGVDHTVETVDSTNVKNNVFNAKDNATDKAAPTVVAPPAYTAPVPPAPAAVQTKTPATPATLTAAAPKPTQQIVGVAKTPAAPVQPAAPVAKTQPAATPAPTTTPVAQPQTQQPAPTTTPAATQPVAAPVASQVAYAPLAQTQAAFNQVAAAQNATAAQVSHNSQRIDRNSQKIDKNTKDIADNRKSIKRVGAMAQAAANLHYNRNESGYAVSLGEYDGSSAAIAGGLQFNTSTNTAITVQASYDGDAAGAAVGFHGSW